MVMSTDSAFSGTSDEPEEELSSLICCSVSLKSHADLAEQAVFLAGREVELDQRGDRAQTGLIVGAHRLALGRRRP